MPERGGTSDDLRWLGGARARPGRRVGVRGGRLPCIGNACTGGEQETKACARKQRGGEGGKRDDAQARELSKSDGGLGPWHARGGMKGRRGAVHEGAPIHLAKGETQWRGGFFRRQGQVCASLARDGSRAGGRNIWGLARVRSPWAASVQERSGLGAHGALSYKIWAARSGAGELQAHDRASPRPTRPPPPPHRLDCRSVPWRRRRRRRPQFRSALQRPPRRRWRRLRLAPWPPCRQSRQPPRSSR